MIIALMCDRIYWYLRHLVYGSVGILRDFCLLVTAQQTNLNLFLKMASCFHITHYIIEEKTFNIQITFS